MEINFRRLIRIFWIRRNSAILSNYPILLHKTSQNCLSYFQDTLASSRKTISSKKNTEKFNKLHLSDDYITILQEYKDDYKNMDGQLTMKVLTAVFRTVKHKHHPINIQKNEQFLQLCDAISANIRSLNTFDLIEVLKIMTYFEVSSQSLIVNTVLQLLTIRVNEISAVHIPFLHFLLLRQQQHVPLVKALLTATPIVFQNEYKMQVDIENIKDLTGIFKFACTNSNEFVVANIAKALLKSFYIDVRNAKKIYLAISKLNVVPIICLELLSIVQNILAAHANDLSFMDIYVLLTTINRNILVKQNEFYEELLIEALTNAFLAFNPNLSRSFDILRKLNNISYNHMALLDYCAAQYSGQSNRYICHPFHMVQSIVKALTIVNYKPDLWNMIKDIILNNNIVATSSNTYIVPFTLDVISLDCYHPDLVKKAFQANILESAKEMRDIEKYELLLLYQSIKTLYPEYDGPWPKTTILQQAQACGPIFQNDSLNNALEWAVGGAQYIRSDLTTKLGHFIDHVVVMQPGGQPVVINSDKDAAKNTEFIEDIKLPPNCRMVLIFIFPSMAYSVNYQHLKSTWRLKLRSVKKLMDCSTIAINSNLWSNLLEREKIPYLRQAIRLTCDDKPVSMICQYV